MEAIPVVNLLRKSLVLPATPTNRGPVFLSCLDIFWQDIHYNRRVIFYKTSPQDLIGAVEHLKESLSLVLVRYYHWAGRIAVGEDNRLTIDCNDLGVEFVEASVNLPMKKLDQDDFAVNDFFDSLCQRLENSGEHLYTSPLLSVQATQFSDGGLAVAVAISHVVADGQSLWNFLKSWGECARGEALSLVPLHERERLAVQDPSPEKAFLEFEAEEAVIEGGSTRKAQASFTVNMEPEKSEATEETAIADAEKPTAAMTEIDSVNGTARETAPDWGTEKPVEHDGSATNGDEGSELKHLTGEETRQDLFHMSGTSIRKLKSEAAATTGKSFSSLVILCAHFWQRVTIARLRPSTETVGLGVLMNFRSRITPPLPPAYFGNVITFAMVSSDAGTIAEESLGAIATRIERAVNSSTEERLRGLMNWLELHDNRILNVTKFQGSIMSVSSSPHFPVYEVDFGWGKPAAVRAAKVEGDGELILFGGRPGSGPGDVEICARLSSAAIENLRRDPHFLATARPAYLN